MDDTNSLIEQRKAKLAALRAKGIDPFKNKFTPTETCAAARANYTEGREVALAGRITAHRDMGKSMFLDVRDQSGRMQIYAQKNVLGDEQFAIFQHLDLADFIGVKGTMFTTKTNEITVKITGFVILAKALRSPPAKWHGLEDTEIRYRQRYLDLMASKAAAPGTSTTGFEKGSPGDVLLLRSEIIREIRSFMHARGYVEVETPMMQAIPGGAAAQPFVTKHNALGCNFYLRIALELYLKRLLVGGVDKVFEIGRNFRNEGLSRKHNPEFTMLEAYEAYGDYESMMELVQGMVCHVAEKVLGTLVIEHRSFDVQSSMLDVRCSPSQETSNAEHRTSNTESSKVTKTINLTPPWRRVKYKDLVREKAGADWFAVSAQERRQRAHDLGAEIGKEYEDFEVTGAVFEKLIEPTLIQPTFVTHLPKELVPLAKLTPDDPTTVEVFECCINGQEIAPAYTEQNDPIAQRERLEHQAGGEQQKLDEDFLVALEHGMPPAGGMGMGIDRLCMMLLGQESIRDVILFPQLKPK
jgi:lysyl-tRNA synthetase class 2